MTYTVSVSIETPSNIGLPPEIIQQVIKAESAKSQKNLLRKMTRYPSRPAGSTYQRTGQLRRSWRAEPIHNAIASRGVPYARYVQADSDQAGIHRGRWTTDKIAVERESKTYTRNVRSGLARARSQRGGTGASVRTVRTIFTVT